MHVQPILGDPTLLLAFEGWNDACGAASTAVRCVNDLMNAVPLGEIDPDEYFDFTVLRPEVRYRSGRSGQIVWPTTEFRYGVVEEGHEIITGLGIEPHLRWRSFCDAIVELAVDMGVRRCVTLGAYLADVVYSQPVIVTGHSTSPRMLDRFEVVPTSYEGMTGIVGVLSNVLQEEGVEVVSLWAGLPHYITATPNPRGALALLRKVSQYVGAPLDLKALREESVEFEAEMSKIVAADDELTEYVKELKRREFAQ